MDLRRSQGPGAAGAVEVDADDKIKLFREQGLSGAELSTLARFSAAKRYPAGTVLFHEGDSGDEMYIILEGQVMISKFIPGGGEEAVAILGRGEFFGEMSLLDGQPRSADAKAFKGPVTLIAISQPALAEVMAMEPRSAFEFIKLLCRLICHRLHEIDEKLIGWHIVSGASSGTQVHLEEPIKAARA
ncbi:MAG: cyclic nucleotide-binding domain-containing protein [Nitrospiraceae bacterium]|nr:cyclic nucleotide-binding domain-containing protein [Nitrospiraceae bacterium]